MFKLGIITDGISRDFEYALDTMVETGLEYVELQYLWEKQVGDLTDADVERVRGLIDARNLKVSCISHHNLSALPVDTAIVAPAYREHITTLQRCIDVAQALGTNLVRIFSFRKEMVLFGCGAGYLRRRVDDAHEPIGRTVCKSLTTRASRL